MSLSLTRTALRRVAGPSTARAFSTTPVVEIPKKEKKALQKAARLRGKGRAAAAAKAAAAAGEVLELSEAVRVMRALEIQSPHSAFVLEVGSKHNKPNAPPLRGRISLPTDPRRTADTIVVFAEADSLAANNAKEAGAHIIGGQDLFPKILSGEIVPTKCLATSGMMPAVSQALARFLGPKGLMPNVKRGTVGEGSEMGRLVEEAGGSIEFRADKAGTVKIPVARMTFAPQEIETNIRTFMDYVRDQSVKLSNQESALARVSRSGKLTRVRLETTHGPCIEVKGLI